MPYTVPELQKLNEKFEKSSTEDILQWAWNRFGTKAAIGTSFQGAGLVAIHIAQRAQLSFPVFTLDTGLLFPETIKLKKDLENFFKIKIETIVPDLTLEKQAELRGPELWKKDPDACCSFRKVEPLQKKLRELDSWITGLRRQQSESRSGIDLFEVYEFDSTMNREIMKINPMANWKREAIWEYIKQHQIPYNPLHDQGYHSIGCVPCTSKVDHGSNERAGRWTGFNKTECGIHTFMKKSERS